MDSITEIVSMRDIISTYHKPVRKDKGRVSCPFHTGKDNNLSYNNEVFQCWVCGESGNAITFVSKLFSISNYEAVQKIAQDFNIVLKDSKKLHAKKKDRPVRKNDIFTEWWNESLDILAEFYRRYNQDERFRSLIPKVEKLHQALLDTSPVESYYNYEKEIIKYNEFIKDIRRIEAEPLQFTME